METLDFVNREHERQELEAAARHGGLLVVYGRRRVGKTRLLRRSVEARQGLYSQAIEGPRDMQIEQVYRDVRARLDTALVPKTWAEFFEILSLQKRRWTLCLDEFPYLTSGDPALPSQLQRWLDHGFPRGCLLILAGSSTRMMHGLFLNRAAPLYGRARKLLHVAPMDYAAFCAACQRPAADMDSFEQFSLVGGVPKYWEFVERRQTTAALADALYFDDAAYMEQEPQRLLRDEGVAGINALAVLESVGRGAERPSEIAARLGTAQTNLSRLLQQLLDASILVRDLPYGESVRSTRKVLYRIQDPTLRCWFRLYSPHRSLWRTYSATEKKTLIHGHAATVFEDLCRSRYPGAQRYWESALELDLVAPDPDNRGGLLVAEVKWKKLAERARATVRHELERKWAQSALARRHTKVRFDVFDADSLTRLSRPA
jgi:hypothetical protein